MKKNDISGKLAKKRAALIERTSLALGINQFDAEALLSIGRQQSLRLNPLKFNDKQTVIDELTKLGWKGQQFTWCQDGYTVTEGLKAIKDSQLVTNGQIYIQNASSWLPVLALDPQPGETILDICAAPGGKASHIAAITNNKAHLWINDNSRPRLSKIKANFTRLNVEPTEYTLFDARYLTKKLPTMQFDKILLDAPCSGEGMLTLDSKHIAAWSVAHIRRLQTLQKQIIIQAWELLKPGGTLVYSTCTMAPEENEMVIDYLVRKTVDAFVKDLGYSLPNQYPELERWNDKQLSPDVAKCLRLGPSLELEAFFVAKLIKL